MGVWGVMGIRGVQGGVWCGKSEMKAPPHGNTYQEDMQYPTTVSRNSIRVAHVGGR